MDAVAAAVVAALARASGVVYVGFSGGLDSTVLLHAAAAQRRRDVVALHIDHGIHPDSSRWRERCAATAARLGVGFQAQRLEIAAGNALEARARSARYRVFAQRLGDPDACLLLAHHRDDQAETGLLRLLQGRGLYGMPAVRPLAAGRLVRPLLTLSRSALRAYADAHDLDWIDDPGNLDLTMDRNFLRQQLLPALRQRWPDVDAALFDAMAACREADALAASALGVDLSARRLPLSALTAADAGVTRLRLWLQAHRLALPRQAALREFLRQATSASRDRQPQLVLAQGWVLTRHRDCLYLRGPAPRLAEAYPLTVPGRLTLPHGELSVEAAADGVRPVPPVTVRFRRGGERLRSGGRERSVKQLLQQSALAPWQRAVYPLLWDAWGLLALPGLAVRDDDGVGGPRYRVQWSPR